MDNQMVNKLRNNFLALMTISFSAILILAFSIIFLLRFSAVQMEIQNQLDSWNPISSHLSGENYFTVELDQFGNVLVVNSEKNMRTTDYAQLITSAIRSSANYQQIQHRGETWAFVLRQGAGIRQVVMENSAGEVVSTRYVQTPNHNSQYLLFLNVSVLVQELTTLAWILVGVGFLALLIIGGTSFFVVNHMIRPISNSFERQKQFIADASHELKTPLAIIKSNYGLIVDNKDETVESQMEWLEFIEFATNRLTNLTEDLLALAHLDKVYESEIATYFNLSNLLGEVIKSMAICMEKKNIVINSHILPDIYLKQEIDKMGQLFIILMDNAIKYTEEDGWIGVNLRKYKRQIIVEVKNSGPGIEPKSLPRVFDRFYRAESSRNSGGSGLGLAIAKKIVEEAGGSIEAWSVTDLETGFKVILKEV